MRLAIIVAASTVIAALAASGATPQAEPSVEPWAELVARAESVMACRANDQDTIADPVDVALKSYNKALMLLDHSRSNNPVVVQIWGDARARIIFDKEALSRKRHDWDVWEKDAAKLLAGHTPDRAADLLDRAKAPHCWQTFTALRTRIENERQASRASVEEGESALEAAHSSFTLALAAASAHHASVAFRRAHERNLDLKQLLERRAEVERFQREMSRPEAPNEIVVFSEPSSSVAVIGYGFWPGCQITPCRMRFPAAYFDPSGGRSAYSGRLPQPIAAVLTRPGYWQQQVALTAGPRNWPSWSWGRWTAIPFYYFPQTHFTARLTLHPFTARLAEPSSVTRGR